MYERSFQREQNLSKTQTSPSSVVPNSVHSTQEAVCLNVPTTHRIKIKHQVERFPCSDLRDYLPCPLPFHAFNNILHFCIAKNNSHGGKRSAWEEGENLRYHTPGLEKPPKYMNNPRGPITQSKQLG